MQRQCYPLLLAGSNCSRGRQRSRSCTAHQSVHFAALQELADAHTAPSTAPSRKRLPKGTSDYQAAWITEAAGPDDLSSGSDDEDAALPQQQGHSMEEASEAGGSMEDDDETDDMLVSADDARYGCLHSGAVPPGGRSPQ